MSDHRVPLYWVGHSFGGYALGPLPNPQKITAAYCYGTGAVWAGWMRKWEAFKVRFMWATVMPLIVRIKGYMAWSMLGMGDDLPLGVYKDWKRWCRYPHYFSDDPQMAGIKKRYANVRTPTMFARALDEL